MVVTVRRRHQGEGYDEGEEAVARRADGVGTAAAALGEGLHPLHRPRPRQPLRRRAHKIGIAVLIYKPSKERTCAGVAFDLELQPAGHARRPQKLLWSLDLPPGRFSSGLEDAKGVMSWIEQ